MKIDKEREKLANKIHNLYQDIVYSTGTFSLVKEEIRAYEQPYLDRIKELEEVSKEAYNLLSLLRYPTESEINSLRLKFKKLIEKN